MDEQLVVLGIVGAAIVGVAAVVLFVLRKSNSLHRSTGPDQGGTFGGISNIVPGIFDPGTAPPPTHEETDHMRGYDEQSKPKEEN